MRTEFAKCLRQGSIAPFSAAKRLVSKEFGQADHDLQAAIKSNDNGEHKWATIQAYYAMFHAARALLYAEGYREKSHYCLSTALLELYVDTGRLPLRAVKDFDRAMLLREEADYRGSFAKAGADNVIANAERLIALAKALAAT
jgi:uncharacterized protein (UPF0332 family)